ncbi:hypothetical protein [Burkholderia ubonensis]|uniref:hypothetical protein n=1 Tax=Burkholderia ubonensis TaxID=101571 RepID=UPI0012FA6ED7|nr:hypothetical protein [Burkholderia ubonensis]
MSDRLNKLHTALRRILQEGIETLSIADHCADELEGWEKPSDLCHDCVDTWLNANGDGRAVRGWLIDGYLGDRYRLVAHSMVRASNGLLLDVTLTRALYERRFVEHPMFVGGFFALLCANPPVHELWVDAE